MSRTTGAANQLRELIAAGVESPALQTSLAMVEFEERENGSVTMRMPKGVELFDELWKCTHLLVQEHNEHSRRKLSVSRAGSWPTVDELAKILGQIRWLWTRWIPVGFLTLLVGEPGTGKSFVALDWVKRVVESKDWPTGERNYSRGNYTIWIETESSQQLLTARSASLRIPQDHIVVPGFGNDMLGQPDLMLEADKQRTVNAIEQVKPGIVILDSLGGAHTRGENRIEEVRPMLDFLARLSRDKSIPIVAVHHLRKRGAGESIEISLDRVRGSGAISAFARCVIALDGVNTKILSVIKSNLGIKPQPLTVSVQYDANEEVTEVQYEPWKPPPRKRTRKEHCATWLREQLTAASGEGIALTQLVAEADGHGYTRNMVYAARDVLGDELMVTGNGRKVCWQLVENSALASSVEEISNGLGA